MSSPGGDDLFILTNSEELVKDVFELFSKFNHPGLHGADHGRIEILLCQGLAPTAHLVYYCVKELSRIFFKSLTPAAGRKPMPHIPVKYIPHYSQRAVKGSLHRGAGRQRRSERLKSPYALYAIFFALYIV